MMKKSKADSSSLETSLCLLFLYMLNVFSDPVSIISWFSFVCLLPLPLLRARILCLVLSPLLPSLWLMIVLHLSLIDLTCPLFCSNQFLCSVFLFVRQSVIHPHVPALFSCCAFVRFLDSSGSFVHTFVGQNRSFLVPDFLSEASPLDCQFSFIMSDFHGCQTVVDYSRFSSWSILSLMSCGIKSCVQTWSKVAPLWIQNLEILLTASK